ncbi:MAG TPA: 50S ribosomal protein L11 methyltransferase [Candidatus Paceibacterota bacterium]|nr:50S ribosomal protein L11 methyltransferase [Verrucomicrobiota bacterium]HRY48828.1 50S ribosomal protein L11 methyltransferase [Candidatus Paceibacterota bacterium]HRZ99636.1 50S ribosomal protein L11 methyltransferase [Candidatus Paceibacterota bacterium]
MSLSTKQSLVKVMVKALLADEIQVSDALHEVFKQAPVAYVPYESEHVLLSVYLSAGTARQQSAKIRIKRKLSELGGSGLDLLKGPVRVQVSLVPREDWAESWKRHFKPLEIGKSLLVKPSWSRRRPRKNQSLVILDPGLSFGTGNHPTTAFCLKQLVSCRDKSAKQSLLDLGTGSGILAIASAKLGYHPVLAVDNDPDAIRIAQENSRANGTSSLIVFRGQDIRKKFSLNRLYDLICANLQRDLLLSHRELLTRILAPGGYLALAGILTSEFDPVNESYIQAGLCLIHSQSKGEWRSGLFQKPASI